tara:strand:+ start:501 stop:716 length:216 start_codon:yes stop_codon:yes gene_type:complete
LFDKKKVIIPKEKIKVRHNKKPLGSKISKTNKIPNKTKISVKKIKKDINVSLKASTTVMQLLIKTLELFFK